MIQQLTYSIHEVIPYINWPYFDYAWGVGSKGKKERDQLRQEAQQRLLVLAEKYHTYALFGLFDANSDGDDIVLWKDAAEGQPAEQIRIPFLRQQKPVRKGEPSLCLSDFLRPLSMGQTDTIGVFATSVEHSIETDADNEPYSKMMAQTLADRLAEATAERMHEEVRRQYWGYAPHEQLSIQQLHIEAFQGIRPAVGYPSLPDTSINFILSDLIGMKRIGIRLTESGMMVPHASVSGLMISHPKARYFDIGKIGEDQLKDYARRRGIPVETARRFLSSFISHPLSDKS